MPPFSDSQNANAKRNSAAAKKAHHDYVPPVIDWDEYIARVKEMLDNIDKKRRRT
jgi:hypothetical protein